MQIMAHFYVVTVLVVRRGCMTISCLLVGSKRGNLVGFNAGGCDKLSLQGLKGIQHTKLSWMYISMHIRAVNQVAWWLLKSTACIRIERYIQLSLALHTCLEALQRHFVIAFRVEKQQAAYFARLQQVKQLIVMHPLRLHTTT